MNYRKIMLVALVLLAIVTLGSVSASEDTGSLTIMDDDGDGIAEAPSNDEILSDSSDDSDDVLGDPEDEDPDDGDPDDGNPGAGLEEKYNVTMTVERPVEVYLFDRFDIGVSVVCTDEDYFDNYPEGDLVLYLNGEEIARSSVDNYPSFNVEMEDFGVHNYRVEFEGDGYFNGAYEEFTYNVTNSMYRIYTDEEIAYGSPTFSVEAPVLNPKEIVFTINGKKFNVGIGGWDSNYFCNASALNYGLNTVNIYYPGDEEFAEYSRDANITVISYIERNYGPIVWGESYNVTITLPSDATGKLAVYNMKRVGGKLTYIEMGSADLKDGVAVVTLNNLPVHTYRVYANFTGSVEAADSRFFITVTPNITVPKTILTGEDAYILVETSENTSGFVQVNYMSRTDDDAEYMLLENKDITGTLTKISLSTLKQDNYYLWIAYYEYDDSDSEPNSYRLYVVDEYNVDLNITYYPKHVVVNDEYNYVGFEVPAYADGTVTLYVDGKAVDTTKYLDEDSSLCFDATGLSIGEHTLSVNFTSKTQGVSSEAVKFNVGSANIYIPDKMDVNARAVSANNIDIEVSENSTGTLTILVDGKEYLTKNIDTHVDDLYYHYNLADVSRGKHDVVVTYADDKYGITTESKTVDLGYEIWMSEFPLYGEENIIKAYVPNNLGNGDLTITVDANVVSWTRDSNVITVTPSKLSYGNHTVVVKYSGDSFYPAREFNDTFEIYSEIRAYNENVLIGDDKGISLILPVDAKGKLNVTVYVEAYDEEGMDIWTKYDSKLVSFDADGKAYYSFKDLPLGNYETYSSYTGDDYKVESESNWFEVNSIDWGKTDLQLGENKTITFISEDAEPGQLRVVLSRMVDELKDWDDPVNVVETLYLNITDKKATHTFTNLIIGTYHIFVAEEHIGGGLKGYQGGHTFYVLPPEAGAETGNFELGNITPITVDLPADATGKITVTVYANYTSDSPNLYRIVEIPVKGVTTIDVNEIIKDEGDFRLKFNYTGNYGEFDSYYYGYNVAVNKENPNIEVTATNTVNVGEDVVVNITAPADATAKIIVSAEGVEYEATGSAGKYTATVSNLKAGIHDVVVSFKGDSKYSPQTKAVQVSVNKIEPTIQITAAEKILENTTLTVGVDISGATGKVKVNGKEADLVNGKASVVISDLALGENTIAVVYDGDDTYTNGTASVKVNVVKKSDVTLKVTADDIKKGQDAVINIEIDADAVGDVTVDGVKVTVKDGKATYTISDLDIGNYTAVVKFAGDDLYNPAEKTVSFEVTTDPKITAKDTSVLYTAKGKYTVTVYGTDGNVAANTEVVFTIAGKQVGKVKTNAKGQASYTVTQAPGTYKITATALGISVTKKLTVKHVVTLKTVTVKRSAKSLTLQATLSKVNGKYLKNKAITFKFNGKTYKKVNGKAIKTNAKGIAKLTIKASELKKLKAGKTVAYQATYLKDTVKKTAKVKK